MAVQSPTRASLRALIEVVLGDIAELRAFLIDHFPEVAGDYVAGMKRIDLVNLLVEKKQPREVLEALRKAHPNEVAEHEHLLDEESPSRAPHVPRYRDDEGRKLGEQLADAYERKKRLLSLRRSVEAIEQEILSLKRKMREGLVLLEGDVLGRWTLLEVIGRGGFATVWKAVEQEGDEVVALKVLHANLSGDPVRVDRFFRGARVMASLDHPTIVRVISAREEDEGVYFFVMEYLEGGDFHHAVVRGRMPHERVLPLILAVGEGLGRAHARGHVHRDVKPANVLLGADGSPKLTDFDLVGAADTTGGTRTGALGTFLYAAPESLERPQEADVRADVFGLAMTAVFGLYGKSLPPKALRHTDSFVEGLGCHGKVKEELKRALDWEREQRHQDARAFCEALKRAMSLWKEEGEDAFGRYAVVDVKGVAQKMRWIPAGKFWMGSPGDEEGRFEDEGPRHEVTLSQSYWLADTPCTQALWEAVMENNPSHFKGADRPVERVSWGDCQAFLKKLGGIVPGLGLRLPTEAEWEHACRAGTTEAKYAEELDAIAWYNKNADVQTHPVGKALPNGWGLYDMLGNVWEWCEDGQRRYSREPIIDPRGPAMGSARVIRGGSWNDGARYVRAANRIAYVPSFRFDVLGFRLARGALTLPDPPSPLRGEGGSTASNKANLPSPREGRGAGVRAVDKS